MHTTLTPEAEVIDQQFMILSDIWSRFTETVGNKYGYRIFFDGAQQLSERIVSYTPASPFERLWYEHVAHETEVMQALARHYHGYPTMPLVSLLDLACGPGSYRLIEDSFSAYDHKGEWELKERTRERQRRSLPTNTREASALIEAIMPRVKDEVIRHGIADGHLPEGFDCSFDQGLPGTSSRPTWDSDLRRLFLGYDSFGCYQRNGDVVVDPVQAYAQTSHELLGHASHQTGSEHLPPSLRLHNFMSSIPRGTVSEGLAMHREELFIGWMRTHAERLDLDRPTIELENDHFHSAHNSVDRRIITAFLKERERFEDLDIREYMKALEENPRVRFMFSDPKGAGFVLPYPLTYAMSEFRYWTGYRHVKTVDQQFAHVPARDRHRAEATGVWSWKVYPDAVAYFIENPVSPAQ